MKNKGHRRSSPVVLSEGQDAEDMLVAITAYRPPTTEVYVWAKILHAEDGIPMAQTNWIQLERTGDGLYSSLADRNDKGNNIYISFMRELNKLRNHMAHGRLDELKYKDYFLSEPEGQLKIFADVRNANLNKELVK
jgi:hypothetical protein